MPVCQILSHASPCVVSKSWYPAETVLAYRVYLIGGADAKSPVEVVPVYTPSEYEYNGLQMQLLMWNVTLPHGWFAAKGGPGQQGLLPSL